MRTAYFQNCFGNLQPVLSFLAVTASRWELCLQNTGVLVSLAATQHKLCIKLGISSLWLASKEHHLLLQMFITDTSASVADLVTYRKNSRGGLALLSLPFPTFSLVKTVVLNIVPPLLAQVADLDM